VLLLATGAAAAQTNPDWRKLGGAAVELSLASPATGPVDEVWFAASGALLARTHSGKLFQTQDFETWTPAADSADAPRPLTAPADRLPEPGAAVIQSPVNAARIYALGRQLFRSDDGGRTWENLTAYKSGAVIGTGQHSLAVSPANPDQLVVANDFGVWRSLDGGMSWAGLNQSLPNLPVSRILATAAGGAGTRVAAAGLGALELPAGASVWQPADSVPADPEAGLRRRYAPVIGAQLTAVTQTGRTIYAGSADGRIWYSIDDGESFSQTPMPAGAAGPVERIFVDPVEPRVAVAALGGSGARVLRTTQYGNFWDVLDGNLPDAPAYAVTADRTGGAIYVATAKGVFFGRADLENASTPSVAWTNVTASLPSAAATDVRLDPAGVRLYIALDGYGVYAAAAPHRLGSLRLVNGGDFSARPAAPGSLIGVVGGHVDSATAAGLAYPVLSTSESQSQLQVPFDAQGPSVSLALRTSAGTITRDLTILPVSPTIMVGQDGAAMLWDADTGLPIDFQNPAHAGGRIQVWATGLGRVRPDWPAGLPAPLDSPPAVAAQVSASLDRTPLEVTRATLVPGYVGFYLVEIQLPLAVNVGASELSVSAGGQESNRVQISLEP
jgi:uncharacterized protein (TIGR03437 family)